MAPRIRPDFSFEIAAFERGLARVAGVDEVGRGPLAGPVTAAAVVLDPACIPEGLADSKMLTHARRERLYDQILAAAEVSVAHVEVHEIEALNIHHASLLAMTRAVQGLSTPPRHLMVDGRHLPKGLPCSAEGLVKGDARCLSIAAASIVAKVVRDRLMVDLAQQFPGYGWEVNAGYPTPAHLKALLDLGVTPVHRRSFGPVHKILYQDVSLTP
ncbi:MAG: ribonuclease HII [Paracoccaceae bacterium]